MNFHIHVQMINTGGERKRVQCVVLVAVVHVTVASDQCHSNGHLGRLWWNCIVSMQYCKIHEVMCFLQRSGYERIFTEPLNVIVSIYLFYKLYEHS